MKPSQGTTKTQRSKVVKAAKAGKDIGKKGKMFSKIADKIGGEKGKKIAAAAMWKNIKK